MQPNKNIIQEHISGKILTITFYWVNNIITQTDINWIKNTSKPTTTIGSRFKEILISYEQGESVQWEPLPLDWNAIPTNSFQKKVLFALTNINYGETISYSKLAALAGNPNAARAVGNIMSKNPWPFVIPCHRVIATNNHLTGFKGSGDLQMKAWLLHCERHFISKGNFISHSSSA